MFVLTGTMLTMQRLSSAPVPPSYAAVLAVKVGLGIWMFTLARKPVFGAPSGSKPWIPVHWQLATIGIVIYALAIALRAIYESSLRS